MYESQFLLKRRPFAATPDPRCFLAAGPIQGALDELVVCIEQGQGVAVVSAPAGTGKTLLCERIRVELEGRFEVILLRHASFLTRRALLQTILAELNHAYRRHDEQELRLELVPAIRALNPHREALVLVCDEAHMLSEDLLEELRILSDLAEQGRPLVRLVLVGQPDLEETLTRPGLQALNQRIRAHVCLDSFDRAGALDYIDFRITWAGGRTDEVFTPDALELVCRASEGVPRCINQLCDHALLLAFVAEQKPVTPETIREALQDLRQLPLHWNESLLSDGTAESGSVEEFDPIEARLSSATVGTQTDSTSYESVEFGADLPATDVATVQQINHEFDAEAGDMEFVEQEAEPTPADNAVERMDADQSKTMQNFMVAVTPQSVVNQIAISTPRTAGDPTIITRLGDVEEEIVWDRYAAIDGGFPMPAVPVPMTERAVEPIVTLSEGDSGTLEQVRDEAEISREIPALALTTPADAATPPALEEGFDAVCARLDDHLPEVSENPGWDSASLEFGAETEATVEHTTDSETSDEWDSLEIELGMAVCEMASEISAEINKGQQLRENRQRTGEANSTEAPVNSVTIEFGSDVTGEPGLPTRMESASTNVTRDPARPYRNLFSQLRRKQQGLL